MEKRQQQQQQRHHGQQLNLISFLMLQQSASKKSFEVKILQLKFNCDAFALLSFAPSPSPLQCPVHRKKSF
jgi:hypothetical protein